MLPDSKGKFFRFSFGKCTFLLAFRSSFRLSRKWSILRIFGASPRLSRKARFWRKAIFRESCVFYCISTLDTFGGPHFLAFCRTVDKSEQKPPTKMGSRMKPVCNSTALWAPAARGTSRGLAPPAPYVFYKVFKGLVEEANGASRAVVRFLTDTLIQLWGWEKRKTLSFDPQRP